MRLSNLRAGTLGSGELCSGGPGSGDKLRSGVLRSGEIGSGEIGLGMTGSGTMDWGAMGSGMMGSGALGSSALDLGTRHSNQGRRKLRIWPMERKGYKKQNLRRVEDVRLMGNATIFRMLLPARVCANTVQIPADH